MQNCFSQPEERVGLLSRVLQFLPVNYQDFAHTLLPQDSSSLHSPTVLLVVIVMTEHLHEQNKIKSVSP
jgi:hypothetical protein